MLELEKRVEELAVEVAVEREKAAEERERVEELETKVEEVMATLLKVLDYLKIIESPSTY